VEPRDHPKRLRKETTNGTYAVREKTEQSEASQIVVIVCDCGMPIILNAVRRVEKMAPRMNQVLESARSEGVLDGFGA
jgi:hypothetical protein